MSNGCERNTSRSSGSSACPGADCLLTGVGWHGAAVVGAAKGKPHGHPCAQGQVSGDGVHGHDVGGGAQQARSIYVGVQGGWHY